MESFSVSTAIKPLENKTPYHESTKGGKHEKRQLDLLRAFVIGHWF